MDYTIIIMPPVGSTLSINYLYRVEIDTTTEHEKVLIGYGRRGDISLNKYGFNLAVL